MKQKQPKENNRTISNEVKFLLSHSLYSTATVFSSGAVVQAFLGVIGFEDRLSLYSALIRIAQCVGMCACLFFCDKQKGIFTGIISCLLIIPVIFIGFFVAYYNQNLAYDIKFLIITVGSFIANLAVGIYGILTYKLPYEVINMDEWGKYSALSNMLGGGLGFFCTFLISVFSNIFDYTIVVSVAFAVGTVLYLVVAFINNSYKTIEKRKEIPCFQSNFRLLRLPSFTRLIIPNFLRGMGNGILLLVILIGLKEEILNTSTSVHIATVTSFASIFGYVVYLLLEKKMNTNNLLLISSIVVLVAMPAMVFVHDLIWFFIFYFVAFSFHIVLGTCAPVSIYAHVPKEAMGRYTVGRMLIFTFGIAFPAFFIDLLLESVGGLLVLLLGGLCFFGCGIGYKIVFRNESQRLKN